MKKVCALAAVAALSLVSSDHGLAVYGPRFGRLPLGPHIAVR
ncbi:MAG: hypothetical protein SOW92_07245 [Kiritimatiellia bacterium]|nr:hypothetical protein [Kiritimatiellia bacterium]